VIECKNAQVALTRIKGKSPTAISHADPGYGVAMQVMTSPAGFRFLTTDGPFSAGVAAGPGYQRGQGTPGGGQRVLDHVPSPRPDTIPSASARRYGETQFQRVKE
jgi:hypothetical protein